jgi:adenosylmethionine-8-amino-7-oxononanoate aminotransferase
MRNHLINSKIVCPDLDKEYPVIGYGKGAYLYDKNGRAFIDMAGGKAAVANIGHGRTEIGEVFRQQVDKISVIPTHYFRSQELDEYLEQLVGYAPPGFTKAWTVCSGTEAVENACKLAIQYHQIKGERNRYKILGRWGSYHGNSFFALDIGGMELRRDAFRELLHDFSHIPAAYCYRCPFQLSADSCELQCATALEKCLQDEGPETVAAFIVEPVVGAALGAVPAPTSYFREIRRICDQYGILMIADEVMTGFARTGYNFGIDAWRVVPDIIAAGKGMGSGYYPLSGIIVHGNVMKVFEDAKESFAGGHTYSCNPLGARIGQFVLNCIMNENLAERSKVLGKIFLDALAPLKELAIVGDIRGMGLLVGIELVLDRYSRTPFPKESLISKKISEAALKRGVILYPGQGSAGAGAGDHILMAPPLVIEEHALLEVADVLYQSIQEVMATSAVLSR